MQEIVKSQSFKSKTVFAQPHWVTANLGSYTQDGLRAISSQTEKLIGRKMHPECNTIEGLRAMSCCDKW